MKRIIGLMGEIASGKTEVSRYLLDSRGAGYHRFSNVLSDILYRLHLEDTRDNLQALGKSLREPFGEDILSEAVKKDIIADDSEIVLVDGIRYPSEARMVKSLGGRILYITAPARLRYERSSKRASRGEEGNSFEKFLENDSKATERLISEAAKLADIRIENTGTISELRSRVDSFLSVD